MRLGHQQRDRRRHHAGTAAVAAQRLQFSATSTSLPLGGVGPGNGNVNGQVDDVDRPSPTVTVEQAVGQTGTSPINFTVTFNEATTDFATGDGTAGATSATVTGGPTVFNVAVSGMTANGTVIVSVAAGVATDAAGNANTASTSVDNLVVFNGIVVPPAVIEPYPLCPSCRP